MSRSIVDLGLKVKGKVIELVQIGCTAIVLGLLQLEEHFIWAGFARREPDDGGNNNDRAQG